MVQKISEIQHFNKFEDIALKEVMATSRDILETFKFSMIFHSKVTPEMQKQTLRDLQEYRKEHGLKKIGDYEKYVKGY